MNSGNTCPVAILTGQPRVSAGPRQWHRSAGASPSQLGTAQRTCMIRARRSTPAALPALRRL